MLLQLQDFGTSLLELYHHTSCLHGPLKASVMSPYGPSRQIMRCSDTSGIGG